MKAFIVSIFGILLSVIGVLSFPAAIEIFSFTMGFFIVYFIVAALFMAHGEDLV